MLIAAILDNYWEYYENLSARLFLDEYRARSIVLGQDIYVLSDSGNKPARALSIDDDCRLVVRYENGETRVLNSGEVSVRAN
jgi:BirA family biotin operon repressor/biotin-[acetyl-CoA-carboxylase] ligase